MLGVLLAIVIFAIFYLKCCAKNQKTINGKEGLEN